jgi:hypothetical protein
LPAQAPWRARASRWLEIQLVRVALVGTLQSQGEVLELAGKYQEAAATVAALEKLMAPRWPGWVESAALLCRCMRLVPKDPRQSRQQQKQLIERYGNRALDLLEGLGRRVPNLASTLQGNDFRPLRSPPFRGRYQKLLDRATR